MGKRRSRSLLILSVHFYRTIPRAATLLQVERLVSEGRLELVGGGWAMNDEASVHYTAIIDNVGTGIAHLKSLFGKKVVLPIREDQMILRPGL